MINYLLSASNHTDLIFMILCFCSAILGCALPRTQDIFLGEVYGKNNVFINVIREGSKVIWFLTGLLLLCRSVVVGFREFSFSVLFFYVFVVLLSLGFGLLCHHFSEKIWHKKHYSHIKEIAYSNPIFLKIMETWNASDVFKSIYILNDRVVFVCSSVSAGALTCSTEKITTPVSSNKEAESVAKNMAEQWKSAWQYSFIANNGGAACFLFSVLGYDNASDTTVEQLTEVLAKELNLKSGTVKHTFDLHYTSSYSYLAGRGETLHQKTDTDSYSASATALAAGVVYLPEQKQVHEEAPLKKW